MNQIAVPPGLGQHTLARVDEDDGEIRGGRARNHVPCILLMARSVRDDELTLVGGKEPIGDINCYALLTLGCQSIDQQREIYLLPLGSNPLAVGLQSS